MEKVMTNDNSLITPLITVIVIITVIISGFFMGRVRNQNQIGEVQNLLSLYPNIETMGVVLNGANLPKTAGLMYRQSGETVWHSGHPLVRIDDGCLVGSLFGLSPTTSYEVKVLSKGFEIKLGAFYWGIRQLLFYIVLNWYNALPDFSCRGGWSGEKYLWSRCKFLSG
jgi:hypothetical protein